VTRTGTNSGAEKVGAGWGGCVGGGGAQRHSLLKGHAGVRHPIPWQPLPLAYKGLTRSWLAGARPSPGSARGRGAASGEGGWRATRAGSGGHTQLQGVRKGEQGVAGVCKQGNAKGRGRTEGQGRRWGHSPQPLGLVWELHRRGGRLRPPAGRTSARPLATAYRLGHLRTRGALRAPTSPADWQHRCP
jgi:hypothetical protein